VEWPYEIAERDHDVQNPTSPERIRRVGEYLRLGPDSTVLDLACGKAGPALVLATAYGCRVTGVEVRPAFADAARERVRAAGLADRIEIHTADARTWPLPIEAYDAVLCVGAAFVWGHIGDAAAAITPAARVEGFVAIGEPFWRPGWAEAEDDEFVDLPATVARFESGGLSVTGFVAGSEGDFDHYESQHWLAIDEWLRENPDHPDAGAIREGDRERRVEYLTRRRGRLAWAVFVGRRPRN
jgi:SAM-dependent methyltransferase